MGGLRHCSKCEDMSCIHMCDQEISVPGFYFVGTQPKKCVCVGGNNLPSADITTFPSPPQTARCETDFWRDLGPCEVITAEFDKLPGLRE